MNNDITKKAREAFIESLACIVEDDLSTFAEAEAYCEAQKALLCESEEDDLAWDLGIDFDSQETKDLILKRASLEKEYVASLRQEGKSESDIDRLVAEWNDAFLRENLQ